jgi:hypothetical protein
VRSDIAEGQAGVPLYMEYQIIDTTSCEPLSGAYVDVWHGMRYCHIKTFFLFNFAFFYS